jgi:hypothetical protein
VGHVPVEVALRLGDLAAKTLVVLASRAMTGPVFTRTCGDSGSEIDLIARNLVPDGYPSGPRRCVKPGSLAVPGRIDAVAEAVAPYELVIRGYPLTLRGRSAVMRRQTWLHRRALADGIGRSVSAATLQTLQEKKAAKRGRSAMPLTAKAE